jgi:hypothetical protein
MSTNRRAFLSTIAVAVPAVIAGAPMAAAAPADRAAGLWTFTGALDYFAGMLRPFPICAIAETDQYITFAVRVPRESLGPDPYPAALADDKVGAEIAALVAARIRQI